MPTTDYPPPSKSDREIHGKDEYRSWRIAGALIGTVSCILLAYFAWLVMAAVLK